MSTIEINQLKIEVADRVLVEIPHLLVSKKQESASSVKMV